MSELFVTVLGKWEYKTRERSRELQVAFCDFAGCYRYWRRSKTDLNSEGKRQIDQDPNPELDVYIIRTDVDPAFRGK